MMLLLLNDAQNCQNMTDVKPFYIKFNCQRNAVSGWREARFS